jgi:hypothetical protein
VGYERHNAVIVTVHGYVFRGQSDFPPPDVEAFRQALLPEWRPLVIGPVRSAFEDYVSFVFLPDGSKEGWPESEAGDRYRQQFTDLFTFAYEDGSTPFDVLVIDARFGGDEPGAGGEPQLIATLNPHVTASAGQHRGEGQQA